MSTRIPCRTQSIDKELFDSKTGGSVDTFILELSTFFKLLSYYLPDEKMKQNADFVNWMRNTPSLSEQYISEILYILP